MKNYLSTSLLLFFLISAGTSTFAQSKFGILGGVNLTYTDQKQLLGISTKPAVKFHFGLSYDIPIVPKLSIKPALFFATKGWHNSITFQVNEDDFSYLLSYIDLQAIANIHLSSKFNIFAGPQFSYLVSAKYKNSINQYPLRDFFNDLDLSLLLGIEYKFIDSLGIYLKYIHALTKVGDFTLTDQNGQPLGGSSLGRNMNLQIGLALYL